MSAWADISTAPRDGSPVLVACHFPWGGPIQLAVCWVERNEWAGGPAAVPGFTPTHWMRLPEPPALDTLERPNLSEAAA